MTAKLYTAGRGQGGVQLLWSKAPTEIVTLLEFSGQVRFGALGKIDHFLLAALAKGPFLGGLQVFPVFGAGFRDAEAIGHNALVLPLS